MFQIKHTNGSAPETCATRDEAVASVVATYGEDTYVEQFADRSLVWETEEASENDDGAHAVASIYEVTEDGEIVCQ